MNTDQENTNGWPNDERPIFIDGGFGRVNQRGQEPDVLGQIPQLTDGAMVTTDASAESFADAWASILDERPNGELSWEYAVQGAESVGFRDLKPLLLIDAFQALQTKPGTRILRRPIGRWNVMETPFPQVREGGWAELESQKNAWFQVLNEFPPSYWGTPSRMGGIDHVPAAWPLFARRASAVGFTPATLALLGTALLAYKEHTTARNDRIEAPSFNQIELWVEFPRLVDEGTTPLGAVSRVVRALAK